jgi:hypothetical protein
MVPGFECSRIPFIMVVGKKPVKGYISSIYFLGLSLQIKT